MTQSAESTVKSVVIVSGGMDSVTALHEAHARTNVVQALSFDYGQRHLKELAYAEMHASNLGIPWRVVNLFDITDLLGGSALTDNIDVPEGHYAEDNMAITIVPNRNSIMLNIAVGVAIGVGADVVWAGMHAGDHAVYPDCRPEFVIALNDLIKVATETDVYVHTPYIGITKDAIIRVGEVLNVDYSQTWSCYVGGGRHCGRCGTCVERAEAFAIAGVEDPTDYEDPDFWKTVTM